MNIYSENGDYLIKEIWNLYVFNCKFCIIFFLVVIDEIISWLCFYGIEGKLMG